MQNIYELVTFAYQNEHDLEHDLEYKHLYYNAEGSSPSSKVND